MPYLIEAQATRGYRCSIKFRVKRDAFAVAHMAACLLNLSQSDRAQLGETRLGPGVRMIQVVTAQGWVRVTRVD
jgi:hypothetical protein